jgi:hypothetical protein
MVLWDVPHGPAVAVGVWAADDFPTVSDARHPAINIVSLVCGKWFDQFLVARGQFAVVEVNGIQRGLAFGKRVAWGLHYDFGNRVKCFK